MRVFVYGTLKRGHGNNALLRTSPFVAEGHTKHPYVMYSTGGFPVVSDRVPDDTAALSVKGEIFEIDERTLRSLDGLEGYPRMYGRQEVDVEIGDTGVYQSCWMYVGNPLFWDFGRLSLCNNTEGMWSW